MTTTQFHPEASERATPVLGGPQPPLTLVDLFCGCGGVSAGFMFPGLESPFRAVLGVDADSLALRSFKANHPGTTAIKADLGALQQSEIRAIARRLRLRAGELTALHASPPCQLFSANNRSRNDVAGDPFLFRAIFKWVNVLRPKAVTIENVAGMRTALRGTIDSEIRREMGRLGYNVAVDVLNAADYGVPQHRVRLVYLAYRRDLQVAPALPTATHGERSNGVRAHVTVAEAIGDLPAREAGDGTESFSSESSATDGPLAFEVSSYSTLVSAPQGHEVSHHWAPALSDLARRRIESLEPGQALAHLPPNLRPSMGYRGAYGRLDPTKAASTITGNCDYPSRGRFSHYRETRGITLREAARLQSFPDSFDWPLSQRSRVAQQIGNAVPPLLARALAGAIVAAVTQP